MVWWMLQNHQPAHLNKVSDAMGCSFGSLVWKANTAKVSCMKRKHTCVLNARAVMASPGYVKTSWITLRHIPYVVYLWISVDVEEAKCDFCDFLL